MCYIATVTDDNGQTHTIQHTCAGGCANDSSGSSGSGGGGEQR